MTKVSVEKFVEGLNAISQDFSVENVFDYMAETPVEPDSLNPYLFFSNHCYTRNLIYKNELFEVMAICWEVGQCSRIHNHHEQKCWMSVPIGKLKGQNFKQLEIDQAKRYCKIEETDEYEICPKQPAKVEMDEPIHQIFNLPKYQERAVSLHVYSKPFDKCLIYSRPTDEIAEVQLFYASVNGKLCDGVTL